MQKTSSKAQMSVTPFLILFPITLIVYILNVSSIVENCFRLCNICRTLLWQRLVHLLTQLLLSPFFIPFRSHKFQTCVPKTSLLNPLISLGSAGAQQHSRSGHFCLGV